MMTQEEQDQLQPLTRMWNTGDPDYQRQAYELAEALGLGTAALCKALTLSLRPRLGSRHSLRYARRKRSRFIVQWLQAAGWSQVQILEAWKQIRLAATPNVNKYTRQAVTLGFVEFERMLAQRTRERQDRLLVDRYDKLWGHLPPHAPRILLESLCQNVDTFGDTLTRTRPNPRARENAWWALAMRLAKNPAVQQAAIEIARKVGKKGWTRISAMSVEDRADWLEQAGATASWAGGPLSRLIYARGPGKRLRRKLLLQISAAMLDPEVQKLAQEAARTSLAVAQSTQGQAVRNPFVWEEKILQDGQLVRIVRWGSIDAFWDHVAQYERENGGPGNDQARANWRQTAYGYKTHYFDDVGRWDLEFHRVTQPRGRGR